MIFVVHGNIAIDRKWISDGETWHDESAVNITADATGATCWRWELARDAAYQSDQFQLRPATAHSATNAA